MPQLLDYPEVSSLANNDQFLFHDTSQNRLVRISRSNLLGSLGGGGGGEAAEVYAERQDIALTDTTLQTIFRIPIAANEALMLHGHLFQTGNNQNDLKIRIAAPIGAQGYGVDSTTDYLLNTDRLLSSGGVTNVIIEEFRAQIINGSVAGNIDLRFAKNSNTFPDTDSVLKVGTMINVIRSTSPTGRL